MLRKFVQYHTDNIIQFMLSFGDRKQGQTAQKIKIVRTTVEGHGNQAVSL